MSISQNTRGEGGCSFAAEGRTVRRGTSGCKGASPQKVVVCWLEPKKPGRALCCSLARVGRWHSPGVEGKCQDWQGNPMPPPLAPQICATAHVPGQMCWLVTAVFSSGADLERGHSFVFVAGLGERHQCPGRPEQKSGARALPGLQAHPPAAGFPRGQQVKGSQAGAEPWKGAAEDIPLQIWLRIYGAMEELVQDSNASWAARWGGDGSQCTTSQL